VVNFSPESPAELGAMAWRPSRRKLRSCEHADFFPVARVAELPAKAAAGAGTERASAATAASCIASVFLSSDGATAPACQASEGSMPIAASASPLQLLAPPRQARYSERSAFVLSDVPAPQGRSGAAGDASLGPRRAPRGIGPPPLPPRIWSVDVREFSWRDGSRLPLIIGGSDAVGHDGRHHHHHQAPEPEPDQPPDLIGDILPPLATVFVVFVSALMAVRVIRVITRTDDALGDEPRASGGQQDIVQMALEVPGATPFQPFTGRGYRLEPAAKPPTGAGHRGGDTERGLTPMSATRTDEDAEARRDEYESY